MRGKLQINEQSFEVETQNQDDHIEVTLDGKVYKVNLEQGEDGYTATIGGTSIALTCDEEQQTQLRCSQTSNIQLDGVPFEAMFQPATKKAREQGTLGGEASEGSITAFMPGTILQVFVEEGQEIKAGDVLLILEAMKMENEVKAPADGVIEKINVASGATVTKGESLIQLSNPEG